MHELTIDDVEQVSGGQSSSTFLKGVAILVGEPVLMPSPAPVTPALS